MRISDWSSDVCSSDLVPVGPSSGFLSLRDNLSPFPHTDSYTDPRCVRRKVCVETDCRFRREHNRRETARGLPAAFSCRDHFRRRWGRCNHRTFRAQARWLPWRSEENTAELESLKRLPDAIFCLKKTTT